jgi:hypothetical protein
MTEWQDIKTAPRDGRKVRIKDDEGHTRRMAFHAPHWWDVGEGRLRIVDGALYAGKEDLCKALEWQEIDV